MKAKVEARFEVRTSEGIVENVFGAPLDALRTAYASCYYPHTTVTILDRRTGEKRYYEYNRSQLNETNADGEYLAEMEV